MSRIESLAILIGIGGIKIRDYLVYASRRRSAKRRLATIREKDKIQVLFLINELAKWKTEILYRSMLRHPRFEPKIAVTLSLSAHHTINSQISHFNQLIEYLDRKGYPYTEAKDLSNLDCDVIFYQEPYVKVYPEGFDPVYNSKIICYTPYGFTNDRLEEIANTPITNLASMFFVENELVKDCYSRLMRNHGDNMRCSGIPFADSLLLSKEHYEDPWKPQEKKKIRIIYAPHFSIMPDASLPISRFLDMHDIMIEMARKYSDRVQFAFKPHPLLEGALQKIWGKEKAEAYYEQWSTMPNTQIADGEYMGLFKYSDAMIHDSGSFTIEYLFMDKPVLCSIDRGAAKRLFNPSGLQAYESSLHGSSAEDVEGFIKDVLSGIDTMKEVRHKTVNDCFLPPNGKTACENIMNDILGFI